MNNPIRAIVEEAEWYCSKTPNTEIGCILSIGTGVPSLHSMGNTAKELSDTLIRMATETETTAGWFEGEIKRLKQNPLFSHTEYFRFNVSRGAGDVPLEEWKAMTKLSQAANGYMNSKRDQSEACAKSIALLSGT